MMQLNLRKRNLFGARGGVDKETYLRQRKVIMIYVLICIDLTKPVILNYALNYPHPHPLQGWG